MARWHPIPETRPAKKGSRRASCGNSARPHGTDSRALGNRTLPNEEPACILELNDCSIVTSSIYERCFTDEHGNIHHHIVDPRTGRPSESDLASARSYRRGLLMATASNGTSDHGKLLGKKLRRRAPRPRSRAYTRDGRVEATDGIRKVIRAR